MFRRKLAPKHTSVLHKVSKFVRKKREIGRGGTCGSYVDIGPAYK